MQQNSEIKVTQITCGAGGKFVYPLDLSPEARTQENLSAQVRIRTQLIQFANRATKAFLLEWEGNRCPVGATIGTSNIARLKEGRVLDENDNRIGVYERIMDSAGDKRLSQKVLVFVI